jgi:hypothetical protein
MVIYILALSQKPSALCGTENNAGFYHIIPAPSADEASIWYYCASSARGGVADCTYGGRPMLFGSANETV